MLVLPRRWVCATANAGVWATTIRASGWCLALKRGSGLEAVMEEFAASPSAAEVRCVGIDHDGGDSEVEVGGNSVREIGDNG